MEFRKARTDEVEAVIGFYEDLISSRTGDPDFPQWRMGVYPSRSILSKAVSDDTLYILHEEQKIVAAMVLNQKCPPAYDEVLWPRGAAEKDSYVLHLLAVGKPYLKQGFGRRMVEEARRTAEEKGGKALRLDLLDGYPNTIRFYENMGFLLVERKKLFYEDCGEQWFNLFELLV